MIYRFRKEEKPPFLVGHLNLGGDNGAEKIEVSNRYLIRNGKCWTPVMGELHYSRVWHGDWKKELMKMKAGGITLVSAYAIWIHHEEEEGVWDFEGDKNLRAFAETVRDCGLKMVLRIGPWCHGEVRNGGFPDWLLKKECRPRTDDPAYLGYVRQYYGKLCEQVKGLLFYDGAEAPILAIQLENELVDNGPHLLTLKRLAQEAGLRVPVYTVTGWNSLYGAQIPEREVLPVFGGYAEAPWAQHTRELPPSLHYFFQPERNDSAIGKDLLKGEEEDGVFRIQYDLYPFATCELGGGIQVTHHRRPVMAPEDMAALALAELGSGNNLPGYYMYHGGINPLGRHSTLQESRDTGYPNDLPVRNYDFQAPIGSAGRIRPHYGKLRCQHLFLETFGESFGRLDAYFQEPLRMDGENLKDLRYAMRTDGKRGFVFVNNYQRLRQMEPHAGVLFAVPAGEEELIFPADGMEVPSGAFFFIPWNLDLGGVTLAWATAQPLTRAGDTWFFMAPDGVRAEYAICGRRVTVEEPGIESGFVIENDCGACARIVTLTRSQAERLCRIAGELYLSDADLYEGEEGPVVCREGNTDLTAWKWETDRFERHPLEAEPAVSNLVIIPKESAVSYESGRKETLLSGTAGRRMWEISPFAGKSRDLSDVLLRISYEGDLAQLYVDGVLADDDFNRGIPWEVSLNALRRMGSRIELLICEGADAPVYMEREGRKGLRLKNIETVPVYEKALK